MRISNIAKLLDDLEVQGWTEEDLLTLFDGEQRKHLLQGLTRGTAHIGFVPGPRDFTRRVVSTGRPVEELADMPAFAFEDREKEALRAAIQGPFPGQHHIVHFFHTSAADDLFEAHSSLLRDAYRLRGLRPCSPHILLENYLHDPAFAVRQPHLTYWVDRGTMYHLSLVARGQWNTVYVTVRAEPLHWGGAYMFAGVPTR
jgi:hypothetical protein